MTLDDLSPDAKRTAIQMIETCIHEGRCMGMDEGFTLNGRVRKFRRELEAFIKANDPTVKFIHDESSKIIAHPLGI